MKSTMTYLLTFVLGAFFGAFVLFNLWQPNNNSTQTNNSVKVQRFNKNFQFDPSKTKPKDRSKLSLSDQMDQDMDDLRDDMSKVFNNKFFKMIEDSMSDKVFDTIGGPVGKMTEKITADAIILELDISRIDNSSLKIDVKDGQIYISGETMSEEVSGNSRKLISSSFSRIHPVPSGTNPGGLRIQSKGKNILQLVFPKI